MTIKQRQCLLFFLGYYVGNIDGIWGTLSKTATKAFQKDFFQMDSKVDGVCGTETEKALKHAVAYGMPAKKVETNNNVGHKTGTFWDDIKYFKRSEFACKCGKHCNGYPVEMNETLVKVLDRTRAHFGAAGTVSSGIRCEKHNSAVGGVSNSRHKLGKAVDFSISGVSGSKLLAYVQKQPEIRYAYIIDGGWVHMDVD